MERLIRNISLALAIAGSAFMLSLPVGVHAQLFDGAKEQACEGLSAGSGANRCEDIASNRDVNALLRTMLNIFSFVVGIVAVIMVLVAGFKYITSQGDSNGVNSAKNTLLYAIIGLIIVLLAQVIVRFVLHRVTTPTAEEEESIIRLV